MSPFEPSGSVTDFIHLNGGGPLFVFLKERVGMVPTEGAYYEFGVFEGKSMLEIGLIAGERNYPFTHLYGFDVFDGMPECSEEEPWQESWKPGGFKANMSLLVKRLEVVNKFYETHIFKGLFSETLPNVPSTDKASIINIDCDLYSSTKEVHKFIKERNLLQENTLIYYDDWGGSPGWEEHKDGESRAFKEDWIDDNDSNFELLELGSLGHKFPHVHKIFIAKEKK